MVDLYTQDIFITDHHIDINGHVNNVYFVQWMQDIAIEHSRINVPDGFYATHHTTWFAVSHTIDYKNQAFLGDTIEGQTWIADIKNSSSTRKYRFINKKTNKPLAHAHTTWVYVDSNTGRPKRIDEELRQYFHTIEH